jgi:hypothetical protein
VAGLEERFGQPPEIAVARPDDLAASLTPNFGHNAAKIIARSDDPAALLLRDLLESPTTKTTFRPSERGRRRPRATLAEVPMPKRKRKSGPRDGTDRVQQSPPAWAKSIPRWPGKLGPHPEGRRHNVRSLGPHQAKVDAYPADFVNGLLQGVAREAAAPYANLRPNHPKRLSYAISILAAGFTLPLEQRHTLVGGAFELLDLEGNEPPGQNVTSPSPAISSPLLRGHKRETSAKDRHS